jgi:hypothetical protein
MKVHDRTSQPPPDGPLGSSDAHSPSSPPGNTSRSSKAVSAARPKRLRLALELGVLSAIGVLAATLITVCVNILVARFYTRWDVTSTGAYTLSAPTLETLRGLSEGVELVVFQSRSDPDFGALQRLLDQYRAESRLVTVRHVDPDRDPAEFIALQNRYRLSEGRAEGGHLVSDAALVIIRGESRWVIGAEDITALDEERGVIESRVEQAVTEGLRQVLDPTPIEVCFSTGQGEPALDDPGPTGLLGLEYTLRKNNYTTREIDLDAASSDLALSRCDLIVVAAPRDRIAPLVAQKLVLAARRGRAVLVSLGPMLDDNQRPSLSGLEPLFEEFGLRAKPSLIFERDPDSVLPVGLGGEAFLASPAPHAITQGLMQGGEPRYKVLLQLAHGFERIDAAATTSGPGPANGVAPSGGAPAPASPGAVPSDAARRATPLLVTSNRAFGVLDPARLAADGVDLDSVPHDSDGPFSVAFAAELGPSSKDKRAGRLVVIGSASPLLGATWQDATLAGTRRFVESALAWLVVRPSLVNVPEKPGRQVELRFTEESLAEIVRYVLVYMPATALALGALILVRRRMGGASRAPALEAVRARGERRGREGGAP